MHNYSNKDFYNILGISHYAEEKDIKSAYRKLARKYHPDVNPGNKLSEEKFKEIGEAYEILNDAKKRKQYDLFKGYLKTEKKEQNTSQQAKTQANKAYSEQKKKDPEKPFNEVFSDFLDGIFQKSEQEASHKQNEKTPPPPQPEPIKGEDITVDVNISISESLNGALRKLNVLHTDPCYRCKGRKLINNAPCPVCKGAGEFTTEKQLTVQIPPNVKEGSKVRIKGEGNKGIRGGQSGDLFMIVHIIKHELFTFDKLNVYCEIPISATEAALGADIQVPTIDGFLTMKIPPETPTGKKFRLTGQGVIDAKTKKRGDHIVTTRIELPSNLTKEEKELYLKLSELRNFNPRESLIFDGK